MDTPTTKTRPRDRHLPIAGTYNIRDLGGYGTRSGRKTEWRRFLRADSVHRMDKGGIDLLLDEGLRTVIDLRTPAELEEAPSLLAGLSGVEFLNVPLFEDLAPATMGLQSSTEADPLLAFYLSALETRHAAIRDILSAMAEAPGGAVMFNCTAGKDRTGLVAAMLLGLAGVRQEDIIADYVMTADLIPGLVAEFLERSRQKGGDVASYEKMLRSPAGTMSTALDSIEKRHGSIPQYLRAAGLSGADAASLRKKLVGDTAD
ncbi:tyrosine-protein phosphatase [Antarcticimicrobium sediminis]|uniref:Tyrosine-protein phosphatase n=1 Tax=Antarcticimicrobium sediminis TaxID=2546227 RepID=A0A4R5EYE5_9RHOB|nr:tyrosine-protein phosphatase [Antarcticimicrobium sediminis]TDE40109.1 tyrosine-protein phosphatase [Antarcticimicrobium sediminis]